LAPGSRLGAYEVVSLLGAGGMGEVYKARDTRLDRTVAIKVLPDTLAADPQFRERFEREARAISQLDHAHICTLYDVGQHAGTSYLVLQFLEGETLQARLEKGALPLGQALQYAIQIADALDKAHRAGIVHRDLKPGNIMLTKRGAVLLDFGLAKSAGPGATSGFSMLPTTPANITAQGTILGTFQYMAPEQLEGHDADTRTDIFAFGAVVYEMLTGKKAFEGKSQAALIGAIMHSEPPALTRLQPLTPSTLDRIVRKCLEKDPENRWQSARDLLTALKWTTEGWNEIDVVTHVPGTPRTRVRILRAWAVTATGLLVAAATTLVFVLIRPSQSPDEIRFQIPIPIMPSAPYAFSVSPDGRSIAFLASTATAARVLFVRPLGSTTAQQVAETDGSTNNTTLFWSPDSRQIAFLSGLKLKKINISGGTPQNVCDIAGGGGGVLNATWNADGVIVFGSNRGLYRVSAAGGEPVQITSIDSSRHETSHQSPYFLPDGKHYLYAVWANERSQQAIHIGSLDSHEHKLLLGVPSMPLYAEPGYLLFHREGTVFAQAFDAKRAALSGEPIRLADDVAYSSADSRVALSVSQTGVLIYRTGLGNENELQLTWLDRKGKETGKLGVLGNYLGVDVSPNGKYVAVHRHEPSGGDIWVVDADRNAMSRLTFDARQENASPIWSPDGTHIVFRSARNGKSGLYSKLADGTGVEELLVQSGSAIAPMAWSHDGKFIVYASQGDETATDQWLLPLAGDRKPSPLLQTPFNEAHARVSPDGKWMAYASNETGMNQVYVRPFPSGNGKWQVSTTGGIRPAWSADGKELFFLTQVFKMMAADVRVFGSSLQPGVPHELFDSGLRNITHASPYHAYAVSPDGRFLVARPQNATADTAATPITVVLNWAAALKK
jgi:serine/threonine protein kinase